MNVILYGHKCCGKSTCGRLTAFLIDKTFVDLDQVIEDLYANAIEKRAHLSCREIYLKHGETFFRLLEREALTKVASIHSGIIATGGGMLLDPHNYLLLKQLGILVYLKAPRETIRARIAALPECPAYFDPQDWEGSFDKMYTGRAETYERLADRIIETQGLTIEQVSQQIAEIYIQCHTTNTPTLF